MGSEKLDEALAAYSRVEPRIGIEGRILAHVALVRRRRRWVTVSWSLSTLTALWVVGLLIEPDPGIRITPLPIRMEMTVAQPHTVAPRLPSRPAPLTREERAWMKLGESGVLASMKPAGIEPLRIEELTIPLLDSEGE